MMQQEQQPSGRSFSPNAIHLVRTAQQVHVQLSAMADQKASILMGATFVIFTIAIGQARTSMAPAPLLILGAAAFFSAVFAVLAILPATRFRTEGTPNLLFFGSFMGMTEDKYIAEVLDRLESDEGVYRTMLLDIHQNGSVLARKKYRLLGIAYRIFLTGLTLSFIAFIIQYFSWYG